MSMLVTTLKYFIFYILIGFFLASVKADTIIKVILKIQIKLINSFESTECSSVEVKVNTNILKLK